MRTPPHAVAMGTGAQHTAISLRMRYVEGFEEGWSMHMVMVDFVEEFLAGRGGGGGVGEGGGGKRSGGVNGGDDGRDMASRSVRICLG